MRTVCRYGRFHSPVTRIPRELRCCFSVAGEGLVELDVTNSQPLFLGLLAREYHRDPKAGRRLLGGRGDVYRYDRRTGQLRTLPGRRRRGVQALALMDHPNFAKVLDAGTTPDGRPYLVMELVRGVPITNP